MSAWRGASTNSWRTWLPPWRSSSSAAHRSGGIEVHSVVADEVSARSGQLRPGMFVRAGGADPGESGLPQVVIPEEAVQRIEGEPVVFVAEGDEFEAREVMLGERSAGGVIVLAGLEAGETIVVRGSFVLKSELLRGQFEGHSH